MRISLVVGACLVLVVSCAPLADQSATPEAAGATAGAPAITGRTADMIPTAAATAAPSGEASDASIAVRRLPPPRTTGPVSLEEALAARRSVRELRPDPLSDAEVGQLLWAAQGMSDAAGHRTAPSAGGLYPLELYVSTAEGILAYVPEVHGLDGRLVGDRRPDLRFAALGQEVVGTAGLVIVIAGVVERTAARYGERAERYVLLEAGHAAQNVLLQATALGLGAVPVGAFDDETVARVLELPAGERPLYLIPVGRPR